MAGISIQDLRPDLSFGSTVHGLNWDNINDEPVREELRQLFKARGLIVFKDMDPTPKMQVAVSKIFGPLKDHPTKTTNRTAEDEASGVIDMHYIPGPNPEESEGLVEINGKRLARFSPWHFDHCYNDELNYAGVLRAPINAPTGGRTGFMDGIACYQRLPVELRERLEGKNIIYTLDVRLTKMRFGVNFTPLSDPKGATEILKEVAIFPRAMHPAIWTRETGEKIFHISPWMAEGVEHHENPEGEALFEEACQALNKMGEDGLAYWHDWSDTDMVIWDNHRMVHAVEGCEARYERRTIRTTIKGDYGLGYFEDGKKIGEVFREVA